MTRTPRVPAYERLRGDDFGDLAIPVWPARGLRDTRLDERLPLGGRQPRVRGTRLY